MFKNEPNSPRPKEIAEFFASHASTLSHNRAIRIDKCIDIGIKLIDLRKDNDGILMDKLWNFGVYMNFILKKHLYIKYTKIQEAVLCN
jgi:hypothetical protein